MLGELQRLDGKIGTNETYTDRLSKHFSFLESKIDAMKQYRDNMEDMNSKAGQRPKAELVKRSQTAIYENMKIRELVIENNELKCALAEYQESLEIIMSKYRLQMAAFMALSKNQSEPVVPNNEEVLQEYVEKMADLIAISDEALPKYTTVCSTPHVFQIKRDEQMDSDVDQELTRLRYENKYLRDCLKIEYPNWASSIIRYHLRQCAVTEGSLEDVDAPG
eukprot:sb/3469785/